MAELGKFERYLITEFYDDYRAGELSRRTFIRRVAYITGGMAAAAVALTAIGCSNDDLPDPKAPIPRADTTGTPARAAAATPTGTVQPVPGARSPLSVPDGDPLVVARDVRFPSGSATIGGYLALPAGASGRRPAVLVVHENAGLTPHIRDVARRFAKAGYAALAFDLLAREGGTAAVERDRISGALTSAGTARHVADFAAGRVYLQSVEGVDGARVGMTGYCYGGGLVWEAATKIPELKAVVPYYGPAPDLAAVPSIRAAAFGVYAEQDRGITSGAEALGAALRAANVVHEIKVYPASGHGFHNDTSTRYAEAAATQAWQDTLAWFAKHL